MVLFLRRYKNVNKGRPSKLILLHLLSLLESSAFLRRPQKFAQSSLWFGRLLSKCPNHEEDCEKFCGLLRKAELYLTFRKTAKDFNAAQSAHKEKDTRFIKLYTILGI